MADAFRQRIGGRTERISRYLRASKEDLKAGLTGGRMTEVGPRGTSGENERSSAFTHVSLLK